MQAQKYIIIHIQEKKNYVEERKRRRQLVIWGAARWDVISNQTPAVQRRVTHLALQYPGAPWECLTFIMANFQMHLLKHRGMCIAIICSSKLTFAWLSLPLSRKKKISKAMLKKRLRYSLQWGNSSQRALVSESHILWNCLTKNCSHQVKQSADWLISTNVLNLPLTWDLFNLYIVDGFCRFFP